MKTFLVPSVRLILTLAACISFILRAQAITFTTNTTIGVFDTNYDGAAIVVTNCTLTVDGEHAFASLQLLNGATLTHPSNSGGINLAIAGDALIEPGGTINVDARGYGPGAGPGAGASQGSPPSGSGAGHGGYGGLGSSNTFSQLAGSPYGSVLQPASNGSGGGAGTGGGGGSGGGAIKLVVGGALQINGAISANGANAIGSRAGGGSGGSVWLSAQTILGAGSISADGGDGEPIHGGGGAGGRIAIYSTTNSFPGNISTRGGTGFVPGSAGTSYTRETSRPAGQILVDNGGRAGTGTPLSSSEPFDLTVRDHAVVMVPLALTLRNLWIATNGFVISRSSLFPGDPSSLTLTVTNNATIEPGGGIIADGTSTFFGTGRGASTNAGGVIGNVGSGGGHGGYGGAGGVGPPGGVAHGNLTAPTDFGVAGGAGGPSALPQPGGAGGGAIRLTVNGTLTMNGRISASGVTSNVLNGGGGSGGSVWITGGALSGSGVISADGGDGKGLGGGGGGGRISLSYSGVFSGEVSARGGGGATRGGAGTIYRSVGQFPDIIVDNGGHRGTNTTLGSSPIPFANLTISGGAALLSPPGGAVTVNSLLITSNATFIATNLQSNTLTVRHNATIQAGGWITADGTGFVGGSGPGAGRSGFAPPLGLSTGSGGGHGGNGGNSSGAIGGIAYDSATLPNQTGSGGGAGSGTPSAGGSGGGALFLSAGDLRLDGDVTANGVTGLGLNSGGGSGGAVRISVAQTLSGAGRILANGGRGNGSGGGGGGGGRIAVTYGTSTFSGAVSAYGGGGFAWGGAGTVFFQRNNQSATAQLTLDNGGTSGAPSPLPTTGGFDLTLREGVQATTSGFFSAPFRNVFIGSNAWLIFSNFTTITSSNLTIVAGGGITADGNGSASGSGTGFGRTVSTPAGISGSGAGHGGAGGVSSGGAIGGGTYDSVTGPTLLGSGGGAGSGSGTNAFGGRGGGAIRWTVNGTLQLDGRISAEGTSGVGLNSGGGSGGSLWLSVGTFSGSGRISGNGGAGNGTGGGGGGGGRISITYATNIFAGVVSAFGGNGFVRGGAGTIFSQSTKQNIAQLLVDNGGQLGAATSYSSYAGPPFDLSLVRGAMTTLSQGSIRNLFIGSNSWLMLSNFLNGLAFIISGDITIEAGGGINADGPSTGTGQGVGVGATFSSQTYGTTGGGGGHGGFGGSSSSGGAGGNSYDSITTPALMGSDGGGSVAGANAYLGGAGGRAFSLVRGGNLQLDGKISADGQPGRQHGGGGSGGSLNLDVRTLSGSGIISANGGAGSGVGGGGGGGRIALSFTSNSFTGTITAHGGPGISGTGGAGTIYTKAANQSLGQVLVDNGGLFGTNTPIADIGVFDLTVAGGATAYPSNSFLILSNLSVTSGGLVTSGPKQTNLTLAVLNNVVVGPGSAIAVDGLGFSQTNGPGAGQSTAGFGSGGGYGGAGGASATAPGGSAYGLATQPSDLGSGGGLGSGPLYGGSQGGGAIRLNVGGTLTVDGWLSADGIPGFQDGSGGGSGGSVWVSARTVRGNGLITADGGEGELFGGGGGGGGRIAIYYLTNPGHTNNFTGEMTAFGGEGFYWGDDGSVFYSSGAAALQGVSHTPSGVVSNTVSSVDVLFNTALNPFSASSADVAVITPVGPLSADLLTVSRINPSSLRISFGALMAAAGDYSFTIGPQIDDLYGRPMARAYAGTFTIAPSIIRGTVTDTNGLPVTGVVMQPSGGAPPTTTDATGHYVLSFSRYSTFTVTPVFGGFAFAPGSRSYTNLAASIGEQNYILLGSLAPVLSSVHQGTNFLASWHALPGITYRLYYSTNLVDWLPYGEPVAGSNALVQVPLPLDGAPKKFFRVQANN